jgi:hypothetical protein
MVFSQLFFFNKGGKVYSSLQYIYFMEVFLAILHSLYSSYCYMYHLVAISNHQSYDVTIEALLYIVCVLNYINFHHSV